MMTDKRLLLGIGNRLRGDDAIGPLVVDEFKRRFTKDTAQLAECSCDPSLMISAWEGFGEVIIVDAIADARQEAGSVICIDAANMAIPAELKSSSTHTVGLATAVELARALGSIPESLVIIGVVGTSFSYGRPPQAQVVGAIPGVLELIRKQWRIVDA